MPTYRTFLSSWSSITDNEVPAPKTLAEIYNDPNFFNTKSNGINHPLMFLNKALPAWSKSLFTAIKYLSTVTRPGFISSDEFIKF